MVRSKVVTITFLCMLLASMAGFGIVKATSQPCFYDDFTGNSVDPDKWDSITNVNSSNNLAYGGIITIGDSIVSLSSDGSSFPLITSKADVFPSTGNFAVAFDITYNRVGSAGSGFWISNGPFAPTPGNIFSNIFAVWADTHQGLNLYLFGTSYYHQVFYDNSFGYYGSQKLNIRLDYIDGVYNLRLDCKLLASISAPLRPTMIGFGQHLAFWVPEQHSCVWSCFSIDSIKVMPPSTLTFSTSAEPTDVGSKVYINGFLKDADDHPLVNSTVLLSYSIPSTIDWNLVTAATTDLDGFYSVAWIPAATGTFGLKTEWVGDLDSAGCVEMKNASVVQGSDKALFLAESNSSLSSLAFNSTSQEVSFTISGQSGTTGYARFLISKTLFGNITAVKVFLDGQPLNYNISSLGNSWQLYFLYNHSTHYIQIKLPTTMTSTTILPTNISSLMFTPEAAPTTTVPEFPARLVFPLTSISIIVLVLVLKKRKPKR